MVLTVIDETLDGDTYFPEFIPDIDYRLSYQQDFESVKGCNGKFMYFQKIRHDDYEIESVLPELDFYYINR